MADVTPPPYPIEEVPDTANLFRRVRANRFFPTGKVKPGAFSNKGVGMSTGWDKYCSAEQAQRDPKEFGVVSLNVRAVRALNQQVAHTPRDWDRSHTDVVGDKDEEIRLNLVDIAVVVIGKPALD